MRINREKIKDFFRDVALAMEGSTVRELRYSNDLYIRALEESYDRIEDLKRQLAEAKKESGQE